MTAESVYDLHTHSNISDGTTTPSEIVSEAAKIGLAGIALTDHDTVEGWEEARAAALKHTLEFLPGIELTTHEEGRSIHLLAYGPDENDEHLFNMLEELRRARSSRAQKMVALLSKDFELDWDEVLEQSMEAGSSVGRPHLADALVKAGHFKNRGDAFAGALSPSGPYYVPTRQLGTIEAIRLVNSAGGFPVLAHPAAFRMRRPISADLISLLTKSGLRGIELDHPENRADWVEPLRDVASANKLLVTGSSDYHGAGKPNLLGERTSPKKVFEEIRASVATPR